MTYKVDSRIFIDLLLELISLKEVECVDFGFRCKVALAIGGTKFVLFLHAYSSFRRRTR